MFLILCLVLMVSGCGQKEKDKVPADVIPHEQMVDIVVEAWFMESVIHNTIKEYEKLNDVTVTMYQTSALFLRLRLQSASVPPS